MTAHRKTTKPRKAKQYSADAMALRLIGGLLLVAAGVLMFLSVFVSLSGSAFSLLRGLTFGLGGSLAFLVPVLFHGFYDTCAMLGSGMSTGVFIVFVIVQYIIVFRLVKRESKNDQPIGGGWY